MSPRLSVVLIGSESFATIAKVVGHVCAQTIADAIELVVVTSSPELARDAGAITGLAAIRVVVLAPFARSSAARAAGVRAANAPLVALAEDHCFPEPAWAQALVERHADADWAAVGPIMINGNPGSAVSWANFLLEYGPWMAPRDRGHDAQAADLLPGRNSCYRRERLLAYGDDLEAMLDAEMTLHQDLRQQGHRLCLEPAARTRHVNLSARGRWLPLRYHCGRVLAASRVRSWGRGRRALYAAASPLIPLVRLARTVAVMRGRLAAGHQVRILPAVALGLLADGAGELVGYVTGHGGGSMQSLTDADFRRHEQVRASDRSLLAETVS